MLLQIRNSTPQDAYVKLLDPTKKVTVSFLVTARSNRTINGLPQGEYEIAFATGSEFSRGCDSFVKRGFSGWVSQPIIFDNHSYEWAISLQTPDRGDHCLRYESIRRVRVALANQSVGCSLTQVHVDQSRPLNPVTRSRSRKFQLKWWPGAELNCRHEDFQSTALPTELPGRGFQLFVLTLPRLD